MSPFRLFITRQKLSNALKSLKSKKSLQESTNWASERVPFSTSYLQLALVHASYSRIKNQWWSESGHLKIFTQFRSPVFLSHEWLLVMISYFRGSFKIKLFAIVKDSRSFDVLDVFLTSAYFFCEIAKFFIGQFAYQTRDKQIELPLRGRPILLLLVWLQTKLDSTQSYYHYLLCTQIIKSDLRSVREIWTALILWKINLRAASRDSIVRRARKWMFLPPTFSLLFSFIKCSFRCLLGKPWLERIERDSS